MIRKIVRRTLQKVYGTAPAVTLLLLRRFVPRCNEATQSFLARLVSPYGTAVHAMGVTHWSTKIAKFGLRGLERVLDLGCGPGQWLTPLGAANRVVVGIDIDSRLLKEARESLQGDCRVSLMQGTALALPLRSGCLDAILCYSVLMYTDDLAAVTEMCRVLKPGAALVLGLTGMGYYTKHIVAGASCNDLAAVRYGLEPILARLGQVVFRRPKPFVTLWTRRRIRRLLRANGFEVMRMSTDRKDPSWPDTYLGAPFYFCVEAFKRRSGDR